MNRRVPVLIVVGGRYHDFDFVRLELLNRLAPFPQVRTTVVPDYECARAWLPSTSVLLTYTCDIVPSPEAAAELADWVADGHRWLALHGTNSAMEVAPELVTARELPERYVDVLGTRFLAHPPIAPFEVHAVEPEHPLVAGIAPFAVDDELYLCEERPGIRPLLATHWSGETPRFADSEWRQPRPRPIAYLNEHGDGYVYYLTLGHARGHYDMQPVLDHWPSVDRGSWVVPEFQELLSRGIDWALEEVVR